MSDANNEPNTIGTKNSRRIRQKQPQKACTSLHAPVEEQPIDVMKDFGVTKDIVGSDDTKPRGDPSSISERYRAWAQAADLANSLMGPCPVPPVLPVPQLSPVPQSPPSAPTPPETKRRPPRANLRWLAVSEEHLREHPHYEALPSRLDSLESWSECARFRQSSVQWDMMHVGRLTTSRAAGCLGVLEPAAARRLGVPKGLSGHHKAKDAYYHLRQTPLFVTLEEAQEVLLQVEEERGASTRGPADGKKKKKEKRKKLLWKPWEGGGWRSSLWAVDYKCFVSPTPRPCGSNNAGSLRMMWGSIHEATALLVALNHFHQQGSALAETGMWPGEALLDTAPISEVDAEQQALVRSLREVGCTLGASPDGLLYHHGRGGDRACEVVEVKNHAPFVNVPGQGIGIQDREPPGEVPAWYVPQMQLEMFCVGPHCRSGIMVRLTATKGAVVMRLQRDDTLITAMLRQFLAFYTAFVIPGEPPPEDFLTTAEGDPEHTEDLLAGIEAAAGCAELVAVVPPHHVQRARPHDTPLLL